MVRPIKTPHLSLLVVSGYIQVSHFKYISLEQLYEIMKIFFENNNCSIREMYRKLCTIFGLHGRPT